MEAHPLILIIEDNPADVRLMREALKDVQPPVSLQCFGDADSALAYLRVPESVMPRLILLDFNLPKTGSREMLQVLKEDERLRLIPVAVLTTSDAERDIRDAYALHANCYLRKPVDLDGFFATIRSAAKFWLEVACTVPPPHALPLT
jgi:two-component system, chemotaxis family, response regulator Rcp1